MMTICLCAIAKNENLYIQEWVDYHLNLGFDKIVICDNNDSGDIPIRDIIKNDKVDIIDYTAWDDRNFDCFQPIAYTECFNTYRLEYDWVMFLDIDEFLVLEEHNNIKEFIDQNIYKDADIIRICWKHFTDNEELDVIDNNYGVFNRFKTTINIDLDTHGKSIIRSTLDLKKIHKKALIYSHGFLHDGLKQVNTLGEEVDGRWRKICDTPIYNGAWINHYRTKTIGEFIRQKYFRGGPNRNNQRYNNLEYFWITNRKTHEKEEYAKIIIDDLYKSS